MGLVCDPEMGLVCDPEMGSVCDPGMGSVCDPGMGLANGLVTFLLLFFWGGACGWRASSLVYADVRTLNPMMRHRCMVGRTALPLGRRQAVGDNVDCE